MSNNKTTTSSTTCYKYAVQDLKVEFYSTYDTASTYNTTPRIYITIKDTQISLDFAQFQDLVQVLRNIQEIGHVIPYEGGYNF